MTELNSAVGTLEDEKKEEALADLIRQYYSIKFLKVIIKKMIVDWSAGRLLGRAEAGTVETPQWSEATEEAQRPPRRTRPPGTEINTHYDSL